MYTTEQKSYFRGQVLALGYTEQPDGALFKRGTTKKFTNVIVKDDSVEIVSSNEDRSNYRGLVFGNMEEAFHKLTEIDDASFDVDNWVARNPADVEAARLIQEVRTLKLLPTDKLIVIVQDDVEQEGMELLAKAMARWLGERGQHRCLIMKNAQVVKVADDKS